MTSLMEAQPVIVTLHNDVVDGRPASDCDAVRVHNDVVDGRPAIDCDAVRTHNDKLFDRYDHM